MHYILLTFAAVLAVLVGFARGRQRRDRARKAILPPPILRSHAPPVAEPDVLNEPLRILQLSSVPIAPLDVSPVSPVPPTRAAAKVLMQTVGTRRGQTRAALSNERAIAITALSLEARGQQRLLELGIAVLENGEFVSVEQFGFNPKMIIPKRELEISPSLMDNEFYRHCPALADSVDALHQLLLSADCLIAGFDFGQIYLLNEAFERAGRSLPSPEVFLCAQEFGAEYGFDRPTPSQIQSILQIKDAGWAKNMAGRAIFNAQIYQHLVYRMIPSHVATPWQYANTN